MKKFFLLVAAVFVLLQSVSAREISVSEAQAVAQRFSVSNSVLKSDRNLPLNLAYVERVQDMNCVYVFARGLDRGYVVVSGDDSAVPVLGYADNGSFDAENMPENAKWWISEYARQIQYLNEHASEGAAAQPAAFKGEVKPLLTSKWNQDAPYYNMCPMINGRRSVVGCAATAASQIMYYHKWPKQGEGSISYTWANGGKTISEDFSKVVFDWDNMKDSYGPSNTAAENQAAAELCYYVGVGAKMNYSADASGATTVNTIMALSNYFGYDEGMEQLTRDVVGNAEWNELLCNELDNKRPVFYSGSTADNAGHAFVFDGYNKDGFFHINWGWGGVSDGYFVTTALDPYTQGIGGANEGFNYHQGATIGIKAKDDNIQTNPNLYTLGNFKVGVTEVAKGEKANFYYDGQLVINSLERTYFELGIGIYDLEGKLVYSLFQTQEYNLRPGYAYNPLTLYGMQMPKQIADGDYKIFPVARYGNDKTVHIVRAAVSGSRYVSAKVSGNGISFTTPSIAALKAESINISGTLIKDNVGKFDVLLANVGTDEYYDDVTMVILDKSSDKVVQFFGTKLASLSPGEKSTVSFEGIVKAAPGNYRLGIRNSLGTILGTVDVVVEAPAEAPALTLTAKSEILSIVGQDDSGLPLVNGNDIKYRAHMTNNGGNFSGYITMRVWEAVPKGNATQWVGVDEYTTVVGLAGGESKDVDFNVASANLVPGKKYRCSIYNGTSEIKSGYARVMFIATDKTGGVEAVGAAKIAVYPNPVTETLNVTAPGNVKSVEIYSLLGTKVVDVRGESSELNIDVTHLLSSAYIVVVTAQDGSRLTQKIIKK